MSNISEIFRLYLLLPTAEFDNDANAHQWYRRIEKMNKWFCEEINAWHNLYGGDATLTKSKRTSDQLGIALPVIPNGVNLDIFYPQDYQNSRKEVGFESDKKYVVWCSNPERLEKNWPLARLAIQHLNSKLPSHADIQLVPVYNKTPQEVALYMNAADCLLLTSWSEGSPNVIKEAMASNLPIVTTDVGDVHERLDGIDGCYVANESTPELVGGLLRKALAFSGRTQGRKRLLEQNLTVEQVAVKVKDLYGKVLTDGKNSHK